MTFLGADTDQLRGQAARTEAAGRSLDDLMTRLGSHLLAVDWHGSDAEAFRSRWSSVRGRGLRSVADLAQRGRALADHAAEQDVASGTGWDPADAGAGARAGVGDLGQAVAGAGAALFASGSALSGAGGESKSTAQSTSEETIGRSTTSTASIDGDGWDASLSIGEDGETTGSVSTDMMQDIELDSSAGGTTTIQFGPKTTLDIRHNDDGSWTFTGEYEQTLGASGPTGIPGMPLSIDGSIATTQTTTYEITVPDNVSLEEALAIDPRDPASIPPGAKLIETSSSGLSGDVGLSFSRSGFEADGSLGLSGSDGYVSSIERTLDGDLIAARGPESSLSLTLDASVGIEDFKLGLELGSTQSSETLTSVRFEQGEAGDQAYLEALAVGELPSDPTIGGIDRIEVERVDELAHHTGVSVGYLESKTTHSAPTYQDKTTLYSDGTSERIEVYTPHGPTADLEYVVTTDASGNVTHTISTDVIPLGVDPMGPTMSELYGDLPIREGLNGEAPRVTFVLTEEQAHTIANGARGAELSGLDMTDSEAIGTMLMRPSNQHEVAYFLANYFDAGGGDMGEEWSGPGYIIDANASYSTGQSGSASAPHVQHGQQ